MVKSASFSGDSSQAAKEQAERRRWDIPPGLAVVLAAVISVASGFAGRVTAPSPNSSSPAPTVTTAVTQTSTTAPASPLSAPGMGAANGVAFGPGDGILADANRNGNVYVWHLGGATPSYDTLNDYPPVSGGVNSVAFSPNGAILAAGDGNGAIYMWRWSVKKRPHTLLSNKNCSGGVYGVAFSHDGTLLAVACWNGLIDLWQVSNGSLSGPPLQAPAPGVNSVAFSPVGNMLAAGANGNVYLWNVINRKLIANLSIPPPNGEVSNGGVYGVAFSHDGKLLAASSRDGSVYLWQVAGNHPKRLQSLEAPNSTLGLTSVAFSPVGNRLAAGDADGSVYVWNVAKPTPFFIQSDSGGGEVNSVAFSGDGQFVGAGDALGGVFVWQIGS